jgi:Arc/MetJ family transcription regulator
MRTTITLDDDLLVKASNYTGIEERSALVKEALRNLVAMQAARRLAALGGKIPHAQAAPRRRASIKSAPKKT